MGYKIYQFQNTHKDGDTPTIVVTNEDPEWEKVYQNWLNGKNPTDSPLWERGVFAQTTPIKPYKAVTHDRILEIVCKLSNRWALCLSPPSGDSYEYSVNDVQRAAPFLSWDEAEEVLHKGSVFLFDLEADVWPLFEQIVCDGPTETNSYDGPCRIYATIWSPKGGCVNENT